MNALVLLGSTMMTVLGNLPKVIESVEAIHTLVTDAEATNLSGPDKLDKVLNDFEAMLNIWEPNLAVEFSTIAKDVEAAVEEAVSLFNAFQVGKPAPTPVVATPPSAG